MWKRLTGSETFRRWLGGALAGYVGFVGRTNSRIDDPIDATERVRALGPGLLAVWHGQHFLLPVLKPDWMPAKVMISKSADGDINAIAAARFGVGAIRASGAQKAHQSKKRGGLRGALEAIEAVRSGHWLVMTADVPKVSRVPGLGIVTIAKYADCPVVPVAIATSREITLPSWDRAALNLPFGRLALVVGEPVRVAADADDDALEAARLQVGAELDRITPRAAGLVGRGGAA